MVAGRGNERKGEREREREKQDTPRHWQSVWLFCGERPAIKGSVREASETICISREINYICK